MVQVFLRGHTLIVEKGRRWMKNVGWDDNSCSFF